MNAPLSTLKAGQVFNDGRKTFTVVSNSGLLVVTNEAGQEKIYVGTSTRMQVCVLDGVA